MTDRAYRIATADPKLADSDGDGIPDGEEFFLGTDPQAADTDADGLSDCQEIRHTNRTQCQAVDFFGPFDGGYGTDPVRADSDPGASRYVLNGNFTDHTGTLADGRPEAGDGIPDGQEVDGYVIDLQGRSRTVHTDPRNADTDNDFLDDGEERFLYDSDPTVADTDGDSCIDGLDPIPWKEERYSAGLRNFTLLEGQGQVQLAILVANVVVNPPAFSTSSGQSQDLTTRQGSAVRPAGDAQCTYTPVHPWVLVQVSAGRNGEPLDLGSIQGAGADSHIVSLWWNVQTGAYSWSDNGPAIPGTPTFQGAQATLQLAPLLS